MSNIDEVDVRAHNMEHTASLNRTGIVLFFVFNNPLRGVQADAGHRCEGMGRRRAVSCEDMSFTREVMAGSSELGQMRTGWMGTI